MVRDRVASALLRTVLAGLLAGSVGLLTGPAAALPTSPTDRDLERARQAEGEAANAVAQAEARLAAANERLDELVMSAARAAEAHNGAQYTLEQAREAESQAAAAAKRDEAAAAEARSELGRVAAAAYRTGGQLALFAAVINAERSDQFADGTAVLQTATRSQGTIADRAIEAAAKAQNAADHAYQARLDREAAAQAAELASAQAAAAVQEFDAQVTALEQERDEALAELAAAHGTTAELEEQRQAELIMAAAADAEQAAAASDSASDAGGQDVPRSTDTPAGDPPGATAPSAPPAAQPSPTAIREPSPSPAPASPSATARPSSPSTPPPSPSDPSPTSAPTSPPPTSSPTRSGAQLAIDYARAQLGKPYEWGADGPDSFDCSGLTMRAWQRGGVSLPHWSVAQARMVTRVSYSNLRPGDLIFWSDNGQASGTYHVALYIGGGKMIHAPRPGKVVEIQNVFYWRTPSFYGRV